MSSIDPHLNGRGDIVPLFVSVTVKLEASSGPSGAASLLLALVNGVASAFAALVLLRLDS
jgi:hypothetical protein